MLEIAKIRDKHTQTRERVAELESLTTMATNAMATDAGFFLYCT